MTAYDRAVDDVALAHMQMQIDAETDARWRRWLGVDAANEYERWSKAERATREALTRAFLATSERELSNALADASRMQDVLYEGLAWKRLRLRFCERDLAPIIVPLKPEGA